MTNPTHSPIVESGPNFMSFRRIIGPLRPQPNAMEQQSLQTTQPIGVKMSRWFRSGTNTGIEHHVPNYSFQDNNVFRLHGFQPISDSTQNRLAPSQMKTQIFRGYKPTKSHM